MIASDTMTYEEVRAIFDAIDAAILQAFVKTIVFIVVMIIVWFVMICVIEFICLAWEERKWKKNWKRKS